MHTASYQSRRILTLVMTALIWMGTSTASIGTQTLYAANDGVDAGNCGAQSNPCRSISQAIENATDGDTIEVGAGRYGDLNGDVSSGNPPCNVCVSKSVNIFSLHGADATVIAGSGFSVVYISGHYVTFGSKDHGFTLIGGQYGLIVDSPQFVDVKVGGNVAVGTNVGFSIQNFGTAEISDNRAVDSGETGFAVAGLYSQAATLERNAAVDSGVTGFLIWANGTRLVDNVATYTLGAAGMGQFIDAAGFSISGTGFVIEGNEALSNAGAGFELGSRPGAASVHSFQHNWAVGNVGPGVVLFSQVTVSNFWANNIFGNATSDQLVLGSVAKNCGIFNASGNALRATGSFWGSATGPGPDPADAAGGNCDTGGSVTVFKPFASEFQ